MRGGRSKDFGWHGLRYRTIRSGGSADPRNLEPQTDSTSVHPESALTSSLKTSSLEHQVGVRSSHSLEVAKSLGAPRPPTFEASLSAKNCTVNLRPDPKHGSLAILIFCSLWFWKLWWAEGTCWTCSGSFRMIEYLSIQSFSA